MYRRALGFFMLLVVTTGCWPQGSGRATSRPANQQQNLNSPSGRYVLTFPIERSTKTPAGGGSYTDVYWKLTIRDSQGNQLYKDEASDFISHLMIYWVWDAADRVWLYNSDDGQVWFWELVDGPWVKTNWGQGRRREIQRDITPPASLYPHYVK